MLAGNRTNQGRSKLVKTIKNASTTSVVSKLHQLRQRISRANGLVARISSLAVRMPILVRSVLVYCRLANRMKRAG